MLIRCYQLGAIAALLDARLQGNSCCRITGVMSLQEAKPGQITFLDDVRYQKYLANTQASAVILHEKYLPACPTNALVLANPYRGFARVATLFQKLPDYVVGIHPTAVIAEDCQIHTSASIGPYVVIGPHASLGPGVVVSSGCHIGAKVSIGKSSQLSSNVTLYDETQIGEHVIIQSGTVIGSDGFGFVQDDNESWYKVPQLGKVRIGNYVEIGANVTIDRGTLSDTVLAEGVKLDNQIQIGHNVSIGEHTVIAGCTGIAGSTRIGRYCLIGGGVCINGHLEITDHVTITGMSSVVHSIRCAGVYASTPLAQPHAVWRKNIVRFSQLDNIARRVKKLEQLLSISNR